MRMTTSTTTATKDTDNNNCNEKNDEDNNDISESMEANNFKYTTTHFKHLKESPLCKATASSCK